MFRLFLIFQGLWNTQLQRVCPPTPPPPGKTVRDGKSLDYEKSKGEIKFFKVDGILTTR